MNLQIQPIFEQREQWQALAERENLFYEALEPSMPQMVNGNTLLEWCCGWLRRSGRTKSLHGAFIDINVASGDPMARALSQRRCRESCSEAVMSGAKNVVFHSSCFPYLRGAYLDNWAGLCADFYQSLAEGYQMNIFVENSFDLDPQPIAALMRRVTDPRVGVCLDFGHAHYSRAPIRDWFDALGDRIGYLHLSDNNGSFDEHLPLGRGTVDWEEASALWQTLGRDVLMTLEVGGSDGVEESLRYLKEHKLFGMG